MRSGLERERPACIERSKREQAFRILQLEIVM